MLPSVSYAQLKSTHRAYFPNRGEERFLPHNADLLVRQSSTDNWIIYRRSSVQNVHVVFPIYNREHADIYTEMLEKCESDIQKLEDEIKSIQDYNSTIKKRKAEMKDSVEIIEEIIKEGAISDANLRLLVDKIIIFEKDNKLKIKIKLNADENALLFFTEGDGNSEISVHFSPSKHAL